MAKKYNFYAGPAILPQEVMKKAQDELLDFNGIGLSIMEISHRSKDFEAVINTAEAKIRSLLGVPENFTVMFLQGGASLQFGMIPMNLLKGKKADYVHTGEWAKKAIKEAKLFGTVNIAASSEDKNFSYVPENLEASPPTPSTSTSPPTRPSAASSGRSSPRPNGVPLVIDMSSDIFSRSIDFKNIGMIYAGAQKNIGPAGVTLVIMRNDLVEACADGLTTMLSYKTHAKEKSLYNTPPCFAIYIIKLVMDWIEAKGGLAAHRKDQRAEGQGHLRRHRPQQRLLQGTANAQGPFAG